MKNFGKPKPAKKVPDSCRLPSSLWNFKDNFTEGLAEWDAPSSWEIIKDKELSALRVQGLGFLKKGADWDNYKMEFDIKVNRESAGWVVRAQNRS